LTKEIFTLALYLSGQHRQYDTTVPVDMWTIGKPTGCASHAYCARKGAESVEMLAFAHIPTGTHQQPRFL
jgi:hypothetical protein